LSKACRRADSLLVALTHYFMNSGVFLTSANITDRSLKLPSSAMVPSNGDSEKTFSGKLPFRTKPEIHEKIYRAAKKKGMSVNGWLEKAARQVAEEEEAQGVSGEESGSTGLAQQLMQRDPQTFFKLVDRIQQEIKPQGIQKAVIWMSYVQALMQYFEQLQTDLGIQPVSFSSYLEDVLLPDIRASDSSNQNKYFFMLIIKMLQSFIARPVSDQGQSRQDLNMTQFIRFIELYEKLQFQLKNSDNKILLPLILEVAKTLEA
jgi:hypothetical protein